MISESDKLDLTLIQKYQILEQFNSDTPIPEQADESEFVEHEGKQFRQVAIDGAEGTFYMDESGQIYADDFTLIGEANDDSD